MRRKYPKTQEQEGLVVDLFAGGGGASTGLEAALGRDVDIAINHDPTALAVHAANHPATQHLTADIWEVKPLDATGGRPVDVLWASPDCTHFSIAKGNKPRKQNIRSLAWAVVRWAQAVKPTVIFLENVSEFQGWGPLGRDRRPDKSQMGKTFKRWAGTIRRLGYELDYRVLDASLYGAPTRRKRLFLIARRDGNPIVWPAPTHGVGKLPLHTAAECINWNLPCPSIFERKKPLADKTLWRIAEGLRRFVLENPNPFIVEMNHSNKPRGTEEPLGTVTTQGNRFNLVAPSIVPIHHYGRNNPPHSVEEPLRTITANPKGGSFAVAAPTLIKVNHGGPDARGESIEKPLTTVTASRRGHAVVAPTLMKFRHDSAGAPVDAPMPTVTAGNGRKERPAGAGHALGVCAPTLIQVGYGEREGQAARVPGLDKPLGTVLAGGQKHAQVCAFIAKHYGGVVGHGVEKPIGAITSSDHHSPVAATLVKLRGDCSGADPGAPMPTVTAGGTHVAEVRAFLTAFYGSDGSPGKGQDLRDPSRTITSKSRLGLVTVHGVDYQIVDIGMRMLQPEELLKAQFGRFAADYDLSKAVTKADKVRLIGNSVCPEIAEAIVRANHAPAAKRAVA